MPDVCLRPAMQPVEITIRPPGSKSITNRALLLAALSSGRCELRGILLADDTRCMIDALRGLGVRLSCDETTGRAIVAGCSGRWPADEASLFCGNAGTVARSLAAACCLGYGDYHLDGTARMRQRPIRPLVDALNDLGASVSCAGQAGFLPLRVSASGLRGGTVRFSDPVSSQFVSAVLLAAPLARGDVLIEIIGPLVSAPFVRMTLAMMEQFGAAFVEQNLERMIVPGLQGYQPRTIEVEPDATAGSYFFAAAALTGGRATVPGLGSASLQGDLGFVRVLETMGCRVDQSPQATTVRGPDEGRLRGIDVDLAAMPDVAPTLAVLALFADGPTRIRRIAHLRVKESDRLAALATELSRCGGEVEIHEDGLTIRPPKTLLPAAVDTYDDHRIAMSFALAGLRSDGLIIRDAECVNKTFPGFFRIWETLGRPPATRASGDG